MLLALLVASLAACTSEGGVVGSGISSASGNLADVEAPLRVTIDEAPEIEDDVDANGDFELIGDFSGTVTLRFRDRERNVDLGTVLLDVPAGATIVLEDITIAAVGPPGERVRPRAVRQLDFVARVLSVDCAAGQVVVTDDAQQRNRFVVRLVADTEIVGSDGQPRACMDIQPDARITIEDGLLNLAGDRRRITAIRLVVTSTPRPAEPRRFVAGQVTEIDCALGILVVSDHRFGHEEIVARLLASTEIRCTGASATAPLRCADVTPGVGVEVEGVRRTARGRMFVEALHVRARCDPP